MNAPHQTSSSMGASNSNLYEINASTILSSANQFKNMTDFSHENIKFQTLFQQFSLDIGRLDIKVKIIHSLRLFTLLLFYILASLGTILFNLSDIDTIVSEIIKILKYICIFLPEDCSCYFSLIVNFVLLILYFSLFFFFLYITLQYKHHLCISLSETYAFIILSRTIVPIFTSYFSHFFTYSLYKIIFKDNTGQSVTLVIISAPLLIAQISFLFISCSAYNATPVIRKHDLTQLWYSHSHFDWLFSVLTIVLIFIQTFFRFLATNIASFVFCIISIAISVSLATYVLIRLPFIYPRTNAIFLTTLLFAPFCSISPILAYYVPSSISYYFVSLLVIFIVLYFVGKLIINRRMTKILKRFEQDNFQGTFHGHSPNNDGLLNSFLHQAHESSDYHLMNIKDDHDLSVLTRIGFLFNEPNINNSNFIHFGLEMSNKADFVLSAIQVMLATQTNHIILTPLYQASLQIGKGPFNLNAFRSLFNLMRQEMLTQLNKPLIEAISVAKKSNHYLENTISDFWSDVVKQKTETLVHLLPRITEETMKTELLFLRLARNYPLSPTVYREVALFYYKTIGDYHKALKFQGMIDKVKNYQYNRPTYNSQQNHLALYSSFSSSSSSHSSSLEFLENNNTDLNNLHEKLEPYLLAQDSIMSIPFPPLFWMYATMVVVIVVILALPAVILGISLSDVRKFQTSFTPIETIGELNLIIARIPQLIRRLNLIEIGEILTPPQEEVGEPVFIHLEFIEKESINESLIYYHQKLIDETNSLLKLCAPSSTLNKACSEKVHEMRVSGSTVMASVFDLLSSFENSLATILSDKEFDWKTASSSSSLLSILLNFDVLFTSLNSITSMLIDEINDFSKLTTIWLILIWVVPVVTILPLAITSGLLFIKEVVFTLKLLFHIPKNEILNLKSAFRKKRHENSKPRHSQITQTAATSNKNMMMPNASMSSVSQTNETEAAGFDNHDDLADSLATVPKQISGLTGTFMIRLLILVLFTCIMVTIGIIVFNQSNYQLINMSNAYASSINVYSSTFASYVWTQEIFAKEPLLFNISVLKTKSFNYVTEFISKFNALLYGNSAVEKSSNTDHLPALLLGDDIIRTYLKSDVLLYNESDILYEPSYGIIHMVYITMSCESQMRLFSLNSQWLLDQNSQVSFNYSDMFVYHYEHILFSHLSSFLLDAVSLFDSKINSLNESKTDQLILVFIIVFMIDILYYCTFVISSFITLLKHLKCPRYLLLLVPPEALLKSQSIVKWMTGIYDSSKRVHSSEMNKNTKKGIEVEFIVHYSECGLILSSSDLKIERVNSTFCRLFRKNENEVIGLNFITFLKNSLIDKDKRLFSWINKEVHKMLEGTSSTYKCQFNSSILGQNSKLIYISIIIEGIQDFGTDEADMSLPAKSFSIVVIDQTVQHQLNEEIENEKEITQSLYDQTFYDQIQKVINENENDSFFESQESTIMFTSIKNWDFLFSKTSRNPTEIMILLNKLYSTYDDEIHKFPSLTKIKSIGNTYIVCGGLFSDPSFNTSQIVINYSLKILAIAKELSENNSIEIDVTIGINTGGPITCGVLGKIRPGFDINGEAVEVASKLNSFGLSGFIQISESTYNNVKYLNYNLKERGEIQINEFDSKMAYLISDQPFATLNQQLVKPNVTIVTNENGIKKNPSMPMDLKIANSESFPVESPELGTMPILVDDQPENISSRQNRPDNIVTTEPDPVDNGQVKPID